MVRTMSFLSPPHRALTLPGSKRRVLRRPDLRHLVVPRLSGAPLSTGEIDYDDLIIHRAWRSYEPSAPGEVRYFMYELSQKNPGQGEYTSFFKAVRMCRLTRVPRYLRQANSGDSPGSIFQQQHNVLAALREQQVLFINLIAKSPKMPLIFGYGVQAIGATPEGAQMKADESYAVLTYQLDGTYQQLEYKAISLAEGELLARYQAEWGNIAMARGRPMPSGGHVGASSLLDGNRTDVEQTNNQLESFIRGMSDTSRGGFMLSLVTVPLSPGEITLAWRNISQKLSAVRSDTDGSRSVMAGVAVPLALGASHGDTTGNSHSVGLGEGLGQTDSVSASQAEGVSQSYTQGVSESFTDGVSESFTDGANQSASQGAFQSASEGTSASFTEGINEGVSQSETAAFGHSLSDTLSASTTAGESVAMSDSASQSLSASHALGSSESIAVGENQSASLSHGMGISEGQSLAAGSSVGQSWNNSLGESLGSSLTQTDGQSASQANGLSQTLGLTNTQGDGVSSGLSQGTGTDIKGGLLGFGSGASVQNTTNAGANQSSSNAIALSQTGSGTATQGISNSMAEGLSQGLSRSESFGGNLGQSLTESRSAGSSENLTQGQAIGSSMSRGVGQSMTDATAMGVGASQGLSQGVSLAESAGRSQGMSVNAAQAQGLGASQGVSQAAAEGVNHGVGVGASQSVSQGTSQALTQGASQSASQGVSESAASGTSATTGAGVSQAASQQQSLSDAYMVAASRQASTTGSLGVIPSIGVSISKVTRDEAKRVIGDVLDAQMRRYLDGIEGGAFLYQMFLVAEDTETLAGGAGLLKSAFWGPGAVGRVAQPFHVVTNFGEGDAGAGERARLLSHAAAFTSYRRREPVMEIVEPFMYSSYITPGECAAFCHPPTSEALGLLAVHDSMPVMAMPSNRGEREINLGHVVNGERGRVSNQRFGVDIDEITHTLITGVTGQGKALALDTAVATPTGWTTMGALEVGDKVLDDRGRSTRVSFVTPTMVDHDCYEVCFSDGTTIIADAEHLWQVQRSRGGTAVTEEGVTLTTAEMMTGRNEGGDVFSIPSCASLVLESVTGVPDPYRVGVELSIGIITRVPDVLLRGGHTQRLSVLRGIMDSIGDVTATGCSASLPSESGAAQVLELVRSLGIIGRTTDTVAQTVGFTTDLIVFGDADMAARQRELGHVGTDRVITDIRVVPSVPVRCIQVEATSHLYLAGEAMVPTHNTTTLMSLLAGASQVVRSVVAKPTPTAPFPVAIDVPASILGLDWMPNMRNLGSVLEPVRKDPVTGEKTGRFQLFSIAKPHLGGFTWNLLAVPDETMNPADWVNAQCDNFVAAMNLGEFGRSLIAEFLDDLYRANRLTDYELRKGRYDDDGRELRAPLYLEAIDPATLPADAITLDANGEQEANVYSCPALSRLIGMEHLAILVAAKVEELADPNAARLYGTAMRDRLQSLWRRMSYYAPGGQLAQLLSYDEALDEPRTLGVKDLIDPDKGFVTIIETDGLDIANRRLVLGSILLAVYRYGQHHGPGTFDHGGKSSGLWCVLEEAHELFGEQGEDEDAFSASTRTALYESMHRRIRAFGVRLIDVVQNPAKIPAAVTGNTSTVFVHRTYEKEDRERVFSLLNWSNQLGQQQREYRYLGEMARGYCIARLDAKESFLESAPVHFLTEPASLGEVTDDALARLAATRGF